ncbi:unnamed protein product, partial [Brassica oleracea]
TFNLRPRSLVRKSKRQKKPPKSLLGNYECDKQFLNLAR